MKVTLYSDILKPFSNAKLQAFLLKIKRGDRPVLTNSLARNNWECIKRAIDRSTINLLVNVLASSDNFESELLNDLTLTQENYLTLATNPQTVRFLFSDKSKMFIDDLAMLRFEKLVFKLNEVAEVARLDNLKDAANYSRYMYEYTPVTLGDFQKYDRDTVYSLVNKLIEWHKDKACEVYGNITRLAESLIDSKYCTLEYAKRWIYKFSRKLKDRPSTDLDRAIVRSPSDVLIPLKLRLLNKYPKRYIDLAASDENLQRQVKITVTAREVQHEPVHAPE